MVVLCVLGKLTTCCVSLNAASVEELSVLRMEAAVVKLVLACSWMVLVVVPAWHGTAPLRRIFLSMRFPGGRPIQQALALRRVLKKFRVRCLIAELRSGQTIKNETFSLIRSADLFAALGTNTFGVYTGHEACTAKEVEEWQKLRLQEPTRPPIALIDMRLPGQRFERGVAGRLFGGNRRLILAVRGEGQHGAEPRRT